LRRIRPNIEMILGTEYERLALPIICILADEWIDGFGEGRN